MKKITSLFLIVLIVSIYGQGLSAAGNADELKGEPKLMVSAVKTEPSILEAGEDAVLVFAIKNTNNSRYIKNAIFSFNEQSNEIIPIEQNSIFVTKIEQSSEYEWQLQVHVLPSASSGIHIATIDMSYEDNAHLPHQMSSKIYLEIRQPVRLSYSQPELPSRVTQGTTQSLSLTLMNLGKSAIYNALLSFDIDGLANVGSVLVGTIDPGLTATGTTNLRVGNDKTGQVQGKITLTYEDDFGKIYEKIIPLQTTIEERVVATSTDEGEIQNSGVEKIWWIIPLGGLLLIALVIITILSAKLTKLSKAEESRL